jgi:SAM-dependent methyltransferase
MRVRGYVSRMDIIAELCRGHRVIDLGVVGATCEAHDARVAVFPSSLHMRLAEVATYLVGVDNSRDELKALSESYPHLILHEADIEQLSSAVASEGPFEVAVAGDVIEHLSNPGRALDEINAVLDVGGSIIITCPNAFGAPNYLRFLLGRFHEGIDHVQSYNKDTLGNLVRRHGFVPCAVWTGLDSTPTSAARRTLYRLASPLLKLFPELGGTLILLARRDDAE